MIVAHCGTCMEGYGAHGGRSDDSFVMVLWSPCALFTQNGQKGRALIIECFCRFTVPDNTFFIVIALTTPSYFMAL